MFFRAPAHIIHYRVNYTFFFFFFSFLFFDTLLDAFNYLGPFGKISSEQNLQKMVFSIDVYTFCIHHTVYGVFTHFSSSKMQSYTTKIRKLYGRINCINVHNAVYQLHLRLTYKLRCIYVMGNANIPISSMSGIIRLMLLIYIEPVCVLKIASLVLASLIYTVVEYLPHLTHQRQLSVHTCSHLTLPFITYLNRHFPTLYYCQGLIKYKAETIYQIRPKLSRTETTQAETTQAETTPGRIDSGLN